MSSPENRFFTYGNIRIEYSEAGTGPAVVFCHGFPECLRAQIAALADAGYRAIAPNQRGYGQSTSPPGVDAFDFLISL